MKPSKVIEVRNELGEGISWRASDRTLWWTDILGRTLHCLRWPENDLQVFDVPERLGCLGFVQNEDDRLVCGFESGFAFFWPESGAIEWIARPLLEKAGLRLNDGRVDRQGRLWAGSMVEDAEVAPAKDAGTLYCLGADLEVHEVLGGLHISNGLGWSPDGSTMYLADSPTREIRRFEFDTATGRPANPKLFFRFSGRAYPDGATVDAAGNLWTALWAASRVDCISADGAVLTSAEVPVSQPSCVCFGGADLTTLFVTTARTELTEAQLADQPTAGAVFVYENAGMGVIEPRFVIDQ